VRFSIDTTSGSSVCSISTAGVVSFLAAGTCVIHADQAGNATYAPAAQVQQSVAVVAAAPTVPTTADACKRDGWKDYPDLRFKNQGDCVSYVATHGKNSPAGDKKPPELKAPGDITVHTTDAKGTQVTYTVTASDDSDPHPVVLCTGSSGSNFGIGKTLVTCSATDASGNVGTKTFNVTVVLDHPKKDDAKDGAGEHGDHQDDHH
jgi:hypothetical protein